MSKIMDALQKGIAKNRVKFLKPRNIQTTNNPGIPSRTRSAHEQLADVYFQDKAVEKPAETPTIIRVVDRKQSFFVPWIITTIALLFSSWALLSTKKLSIDIQVVDQAQQSQQTSSDGVVAHDRILTSVGAVSEPDSPAPNVLPSSENVSNIELPEVIDVSPMEFGFKGAAVLNSTRESSQLSLANSTLSGLAYASLEFKKPFEAEKYVLSMMIRGQRGGEKVELIFKDANGNSSLNWKTLGFFPKGMLTEWQPVTVQLESSDFFDASKVQQMRIEFGSQRTANSSESLIFIRDIQWIPVANYRISQ